MKYLIIPILFLFTHLQAQEPVSPPVIVAKLELGKTVEIADVKFKFIEVISDSRCPLKVDCIWEGEVKIKVEIQVEGKNDILVKDLTFRGNSLGTAENHSLYNAAETLVYGYRVTPYPDITTLKKTTNYILELYLKSN